MSESMPTTDEQPASAPAPAPRDSLITLVLRAFALLYVTLLVFTGLAVLTVGLVLGWRPYLVTSGSMVPTMDPGDVIVVEPAAPGEAFNPPTIITFRDPARGLVTHRVTKAAQGPDGEIQYSTKGDANPAAESGTTPQSALVGSVRYVVRDAGMPLYWAQNQRWGPFGAWALLSLWAVWLAVGFLQPKRAGDAA